MFLQYLTNFNLTIIIFTCIFALSRGLLFEPDFVPLSPNVASSSVTYSVRSQVPSDGFSAYQDLNDHRRKKRDAIREPQLAQLIGDFEMNGDITRDHHEFYEVSYITDHKQFNDRWVDIDAIPRGQYVTRASPMTYLSDDHRKAEIMDIKEPFFFYGMPIKNITVCTGGFLYVGEHKTKKLAATQYIAPLMADFTTVGQDSMIKFVETDFMIVIEWTNVALNNQRIFGDQEFTFQVILRQSGDIFALYKKVPIPFDEISDAHHPKRIALSDAYYEAQNFKIVEYHKVKVNTSYVQSGTIIHLKPLPTCVTNRDCSSCMKTKISWSNCTWCSAKISGTQEGFCSDKLAQHRLAATWKEAKCDESGFGNLDQCPSEPTAVPLPITVTTKPTTTRKPTTTMRPTTTTTTPRTTTQVTTTTTVSTSTTTATTTPITTTESVATTMNATLPSPAASKQEIAASGLSGGAIVGIVLVVAVVIALVAWVLFAYRNPLTPSGQFLIQYRPSRWPGAIRTDATSLT